MKRSVFEKWGREWADVKEIVLFGNGKTCRYHLPELQKDFCIKAILDNDRERCAAESDFNIPVVWFGDYLDKLKSSKIVVVSAYNEISEQLQNYGLEENTDYCELRLFVTGWHWINHRQLHISEIHIAVTTYCTLNCRSCNMFMPAHKSNHTMCHIEADVIKKDIDTLFSAVDRVYRLSFVGGEPFTYPYMQIVLEYLTDRYRDRFGTYEIYTNGTVMPADSLLNCISGTDGVITISNYELEENDYAKRINEFICLLKKKKLKFSVLKSGQWLDMGFPYENFEIPDDEAGTNMIMCNPGFRGFNDGKFYFCHIVWSAVKCGLITDNENDYVNFKSMADKEEILRMQTGMFDDRFVSLCKYCRGCSSLYMKLIPVAVQEKNIDG